MSIESAQDRLDILRSLGEETLFTEKQFTTNHPSSKTLRIWGVFENAFVEAGKIEGMRPTLTVRDEDISNIAHGAMIRRNPDSTYIDYKVVGVEPDGTGITLLILQEQ